MKCIYLLDRFLYISPSNTNKMYITPECISNVYSSIHIYGITHSVQDGMYITLDVDVSVSSFLPIQNILPRNVYSLWM